MIASPRFRRWAEVIGISLLTLGLIGTLSGCAPTSATAAIRDVMVQWHDDVATGRSAQACRLMTAGAERELASLMRSRSCESAITSISRAFTATDRHAFTHIQISGSSIAVTGDHAQIAAGDVRYAAGGRSAVEFHDAVHLVQTGGRWLFVSVIDADLDR